MLWLRRKLSDFYVWRQSLAHAIECTWHSNFISDLLIASDRSATEEFQIKALTLAVEETSAREKVLTELDRRVQDVANEFASFRDRLRLA